MGKSVNPSMVKSFRPKYADRNERIVDEVIDKRGIHTGMGKKFGVSDERVRQIFWSWFHQQPD